MASLSSSSKFVTEVRDQNSLANSGADQFHELGDLAKNSLNSGFGGKANLERVHPLQGVDHHKSEQEFWLQQLRHDEGLHLPLKMKMEQMILRKHERLPCLRSSHVLLESLTGDDQLILPRDMFSDVTQPEVCGFAHTMVEHSNRY
jgi:hypothetical protein